MTRAKPARRPEARPDEILDAALKVFTDKGFSAARMDDVAKAAGLSKGAVYLYFDSKETLLEALIARSAGRLVADAAAFIDAAADADPEGTLRAVVQGIARGLADPNISAAPRLMISEAHRFPRIATYYRKNVVNVGKAAFARLIAAGVRKGVFRDVDPKVAARAFAGPLFANMVLTFILPDPDDPPLDPDDLAAKAFDILFNGLAAPSSKETK
ncbi:MAG: TetR/AcrR family transcriptional regulator [Maricaulaceae bacterium]|jgi:AcrR family transcriptional regulator